ncbi:hypothetical protein FRC08_007986 [Ceratobasidium sp. 394]|nr:hypothetical protein FRC08_007986 [Ceratobasidium sp. 394]
MAPGFRHALMDEKGGSDRAVWPHSDSKDNAKGKNGILIQENSGSSGIHLCRHTPALFKVNSFPISMKFILTLYEDELPENVGCCIVGSERGDIASSVVICVLYPEARAEEAKVWSLCLEGLLQSLDVKAISFVEPLHEAACKLRSSDVTRNRKIISIHSSLLLVVLTEGIRGVDDSLACAKVELERDFFQAFEKKTVFQIVCDASVQSCGTMNLRNWVQS